MYFIGTVVNIYILMFKQINFTLILKYLLVSFLIFLSFSLFSGINLIYEADDFVRRLKANKLLTLKTFEWIVTARTYIIYLVILANFLIFSSIKWTVTRYNIELESTIFIMLILSFMVIFSFYHLIHNAKDFFGTLSFTDTKSDFEDKINKFNNKYIEKSDAETDKIIDMLGFIVYMEDKDFFERKKFTLDIKQVFKRKSESYNKSKEKTSNKQSFCNFFSDSFTKKI